MRGRILVVLAAVAALGVTAPSDTNAIACEPAIIDSAGILTPSTRLDGAVASMQREGVDTIVRTVRAGAIRDHAIDLAARCPDLDTVDADAVIVVLSPAGVVELLAVGSTAPTDAAVAETLIRDRVGSGDPDVTSAVAVALEELWQARANSGDRLHPGGPRSPNIWAAERQRRTARTVLATGFGLFAVGMTGVALHRRRRLLTADVAEAQARRTALAEAYLDLDASVIRATQRCTSGVVPPVAAAAVSAAAERAGAALLATADVTPSRVGEARAVAAACAAAERDLRTAVAAIETAGADGLDVAPVGLGAQAHERTGAH